jgi:myo-inositol 2-dehydrogenase/D-chiro-inositol 1-dehydrogenase
MSMNRCRASADAFAREDRAFVDAVKGERNDIRVPYPEALRTNEVARAAAALTASGESVTISPPRRATDPFPG